MNPTKCLLLTICLCSVMLGCGADTSTSLVPQSEDPEYLEAEARKAASEEAPATGSI